MNHVITTHVLRPRWLIGLAAGVITHVLFLYTVWQLFFFLKDGAAPRSDGSLAVDALLALQFGVVHSLLLWAPVRQRLTRWIPSPFYGLFFCVNNCVGLLLIIKLWQPAGPTLWELHGVARAVVVAAFYGAWAAMFYSLALTGLGFQTGFTPWWNWLRGRPQPRREFNPRGVFRWMRHPVYLSVLGVIWFTPHMTLDHAVLTGVLTTYIFVGSYFKDRRMAKFIGAHYLAYQERVPGYPFLGIGPLGRRKPATAPGASLPAAG
jgi:protein-S-isoprenylcysteine O-methyltransferase Ste14